MAQIREQVMQLNPIDDIFFQKMAEDIGFCEEVVQTILGDKGLKVVKNTPQYPLKNLQGRSAVLDLVCEKDSGKKVLVEVQRADDDNHVKRVRYNSSLFTVNITEPGTKFENVEDIICIYISRSDFIGGGKVIYHVDRTIRETGTILDNGITEIYVNAKIKDDSDISKLMEVFTESNKYYKNLFPKVAKRKRHFKKDEEGVKEMCAIVEKIQAESKLEGVVEYLCKKGKTIEEIAIELNIPEDKVEEIISNLDEE